MLTIELRWHMAKISLEAYYEILLNRKKELEGSSGEREQGKDF